jgi:hypothetical protein
MAGLLDHKPIVSLDEAGGSKLSGSARNLDPALSVFERLFENEQSLPHECGKRKS